MIGILVWIVVGAIAGFVASKVLSGKGMGLLWDIVVGILGAFVGGWLASLVGLPVSPGTFTHGVPIRVHSRLKVDEPVEPRPFGGAPGADGDRITSTSAIRSDSARRAWLEVWRASS